MFKPAKTSSKQLVHTLSIQNKGKTTLYGVVGTPTSPFTLVSGVSGNGTFTLSPGKRLTLKIGIPLTQAGDFSGSLAMLTSDPAHPQLNVPLSAAVYVPGSLNIAPRSINFGSVPVGQSASRAVVVINHTSAPVTIYSATTINGPFVADNGCVGMLAAGASCTENVTFSPEQTGKTKKAALLFTDDAKGSPQKVGLSGSGT